MFTDTDTQHMTQAIELARRGWGAVSPNPPVGCIILDSSGQVAGEGWHMQYGGPHAEPNALDAAGDKAHDGTAYVTLMPCNHHGKTPPCTQALIKAGVKRVVVAVDDPNPEASGGKQTLEEAGIAVEIGLLSKEAAKVMWGFLKFIRNGLPQVTLKYAMTLDGKIATSSGDSKWISGEESRTTVQKLRRQHDAIMVGSGTALADNPRLNIREKAARQPLRVIVDSRLRLSPKCNLFTTHGGKVIILTGKDANPLAEERLVNAGADILHIGMKGNVIDLPMGLNLLAQQYGVRRIFCEGGGGLAGALLREKLVDTVNVFIAPKILGGSGISPAEGGDIQKMAQALPLTDLTFQQSGDDLYIESWLTR